MATIRVSWTPNPPSEFVTNYAVEKQVNGGGWQLQANTPNTTLDVANPGQGVYAFRVTPSNIAGTGATSDVGNGPGIPSKGATPVVEVLP